MNSENIQYDFKKFRTPPGFVLNNLTPDDVARAAIEDGKQKEPFYIFDMDEAYRRIQHFRVMMPRVEIFYAMKANDTEMMLRLAIALGVGFDCASPGEIYKLRKLNVCPESIIYAMPVKTPEQMAYARKSGVKHTTFDTSYELKKLKEHWPDAKLLIRLKVDSVSQINLGEKFGCDYETEAFDLLEEASYLGLNVIGVAFHVGCVCSTPESYVVGLRQARKLFDFEKKAGRGMSIVDIGGGYGGDNTNVIDEVSVYINKALNELFPEPNIQIIAEPGRYLCDSAFTLYSSISNVRRAKRDNKIVNMIYINDGIYGTMAYLDEWHQQEKFMRSTEMDTGVFEDTILWGPSCDSMDRVLKAFSVKLPRCTPLDWLVFRIHGAYTIVFSSRFSCLEIPLIRSVVSTELWTKIKKRSIYDECDFVTNPDISTPLPSTLPPIMPQSAIYEKSQAPTLSL